MKSFLGLCAAMALLVQSAYAFAPSTTTTIQPSSSSFASFQP
eukprot:CAMPEP_0196243012 /NCGR_PEP_ID=MMETSP0913-20130531/26610_1 /TAXON_ID=49265 /ORGANISM="Thalassiosira rotula, Strain GSO102" /LENGTH=41 /DNA_ID= /DNA_START= /DNA_END= /DNA_ORIENTATION=